MIAINLLPRPRARSARGAGEAPRVPVGNSGFGFPPRFEETRPVEDPGCRGLSPRHPGRGIEDHGGKGTRRVPESPPEARAIEDRAVFPRVSKKHGRSKTPGAGRHPVHGPRARSAPHGAGKAPGSRAARAGILISIK